MTPYFFELIIKNQFGEENKCCPKGNEGTTLTRLIGPVSGSFPSEVFEMNTYLSLE